ncbi:MAG: zinc ribbon domain-containing protein [Pseudomonadota bacterium]
MATTSSDTPAPEAVVVSCPNCGHAMAPDDRFCSACGQKNITEKDRWLPELARASLQEITDLDGRLLPSVWLLITRPGFLSREYRLGRRRRYLSPIGLFLVANLMFFLAPTLSDLNINFYDQYTMQVYSEVMQPHINSALETRGLDLEATLASGTEITRTAEFRELAQAYDSRIGDIAKSMVIAHIPLLALGTMMLTFWRRLLYADHVVAALHFFAFVMIYWTVFPYTVLPLFRALDALLFWDLPVWQLVLGLKFLYVPFMFSTAFGVRWYVALLSVVPFYAVLMVTHFGYRLLQLWLGLAIV